jgi:integrase
MVPRMGRPRKTDKHLPPRVYLRGKTYYYVDAGGKWHRLGKSLPEMHRGLAALLDDAPARDSWSAVFDRYRRDELPKKSAKTQRDYARSLDTLARVFGHMAPRQTLPRHIAAFHDARGKTAPVAANRDLAVLRAICRLCLRWGVLDRSPCDGIARHAETPRDRYVTDAEFAAVHALAGPRERAMMDLALLTGRAEAELIGLHRRQLTADGIEFAARKRGVKVIIRWSDALRATVDAILAAQPVASVWVLCDRQGQRVNAETFRTAWQRLMAKAIEAGAIGERFTFHDLRAKAGSDSATGEHLGHASPAMLQRVYRRKPRLVEPTR